MGLAEGYLLTTGTANDPLLPKLVHAINHATEIDICVSFAQPSGVSLLLEPLIDACRSGATVRIMTSDYLYITHPRALRLLALLQQRGAQVKLYRCTERKAFHLKSYIFVRERSRPCADVQAQTDGTAFVGSSNLSESALTSGLEWNLRFDLVANSDSSRREFAHIRRSFAAIFTSSQAVELTGDEIDQYAARYREIARQNTPVMQALGVEDEPETEVFTPNSVQTEALLALKESRVAGYRRGLVVMATGMGKTWLAAFDAQQCRAERMLFVAHREEILLQAQQTFSALFPHKSVGFFNANTKETEADLVFASVQSLGKLSHLQNFSPEHFDYMVVDEFHHATAQSYQALLGYFQPQFLLGLTATPERTDQSDILSLCDHNLVYERNLTDGIDEQILVPFHYYGIHDEFVDYQEIPWRAGKFDPAALDVAFATIKRAKHIYKHWQQHQQTRTLGFCISKRHADYMADYFTKQGVRAVAVYSGSAVRRNEALHWLQTGQVSVVFSVDLFNEGTDIPSVDTVLMLRPTESKILFLQQLGRGVRQSPETNKTHVVVLDFIGNHAAFMLKPAALLGYGDTRQLIKELVNHPRGAQGLPPGCHLNFDIEVIDFWQSLVRSMGNTLQDDYETLKLELNHRPTAAEFYRAGYYHKPKIRSNFGGWLGMLARFENDVVLHELNERHGEFMRQAVESTAMTKCFKAILLQAFVELGGFNTVAPVGTDGRTQGVALDALAQKSWHILHRYPQALANDLADNERALDIHNPNDSDTWLRYWNKNPVAAFCNAGKQQTAWFSKTDTRLIANVNLAPSEQAVFESMVLELCELRMAEYVTRLADLNQV